MADSTRLPGPIEQLIKTVLITGAGRGLRKASVSCFLMRGYRVFGLVRAPEAADTMRLLGPNAMPIIGDVTDPTVGTAIDGVLRCCPDGLINNAGTGASMYSLQPGIEEEVAAHLDVDCIGTLRITRSVVLRASAGRAGISRPPRQSGLAC